MFTGQAVEVFRVALEIDDLRAALREGGPDAVDRLLDEAMALKPQAHAFDPAALDRPALPRGMARTGG